MRHIVDKIFIIVLMLYMTNIKAQNVSVSFSLYEEAITEADTLAPYLCIRYTNIGKNDYYLPALFPVNMVIPAIASYFSKRHFSENVNLRAYAISSFRGGDYLNEHYFLSISFLQDKIRQKWFLEHNTDEETEVSLIGFLLSLYYEDIENSSISDPSYFSKEELCNPDFISNCPSFIFLKSGKTKEQFVSLRGMKEAGIVLTVQLTSDQVPNSMNVGYSVHGSKCKLPSKVKGYKLYKGKVKSNNITINFGNEIL